MNAAGLVTTVQNGLEHVVFGNGWLALSALLIVCGVAVLVRLTGGVRV